jgi:NAD(P)-dependent dehydrogenase (short-subunit alcohol dehydrogenase family)
MELDLTGRVVLVTGASRGIGHAVARALVVEGARVAICSRDEATCLAAATQLGESAAGFVADVRDEAAVGALVAQVVERFGRLDAVVNNAGRFGGGPVTELDDEALHFGLDTKLAGALHVVRHALPHLRASDRSAVVNVSGITAEKVIAGAGVTAMGNAGLLTLTAYLAQELMADGVRVNGVVPGYTLTEVWRDRAQALANAEGLSLEEAEQAILDRQGLGHARWGTAEEVADVIVVLLSRAMRFVTGAVVRVDGGQWPAIGY